MLELETFNEAIDMLRQIISQQQQVGQRTREQRSQKVRNLLQDEDSP
jgi:hypothetical protein